MQTMTGKTRTAVTVGAVLLGLAIVAVVLYANRGKMPTTQNSTDTHVTQEAAGSYTQQPGMTNPALGAVSAAEQDPKETGAAEGTAAEGTADGVGAGAGAMSPLEQGSAQTMAGAEVPETYTVTGGDSLRSIALKFYGDAIYSADIETLNALPDPDVITMGQVLQMPRLEDIKQH